MAQGMSSTSHNALSGTQFLPFMCGLDGRVVQPVWLSYFQFMTMVVFITKSLHIPALTDAVSTAAATLTLIKGTGPPDFLTYPKPPISGLAPTNRSPVKTSSHSLAPPAFTFFSLHPVAHLSVRAQRLILELEMAPSASKIAATAGKRKSHPVFVAGLFETGAQVCHFTLFIAAIPKQGTDFDAGRFHPRPASSMITDSSSQASVATRPAMCLALHMTLY